MFPGSTSKPFSESPCFVEGEIVLNIYEATEFQICQDHVVMGIQFAFFFGGKPAEKLSVMVSKLLGLHIWFPRLPP